MRARLTMAIAIAVPLALGAAGTALAMSADSAGTTPIKKLLPPPPSPSPEEILPGPVQKVISEATQPAADTGAETDEGATGSPGGGEGGSQPTGSSVPTASGSGLTWSWSVPYGGWRRFLQAGDTPYATSSWTLTTSAPVQGVRAGGTAGLARIAATVPRTPAYLWVLLPLGLFVLWVAGLAVFEPAGERGRLMVFAGSVRRTARDLPAGMTRSVVRTAVRAVRGLGRWGRR